MKPCITRQRKWKSAFSSGPPFTSGTSNPVSNLSACLIHKTKLNGRMKITNVPIFQRYRLPNDTKTLRRTRLSGLEPRHANLSGTVTDSCPSASSIDSPRSAATATLLLALFGMNSRAAGVESQLTVIPVSQVLLSIFYLSMYALAVIYPARNGNVL
jgi:hypothetical protein